jgi:hypothetical protein
LGGFRAALFFCTGIDSVNERQERTLLGEGEQPAAAPAPRLRGMRVVRAEWLFAVGVLKGLAIFAATGAAFAYVFNTMNARDADVARALCDQVKRGSGYQAALVLGQNLAQPPHVIDSAGTRFRLATYDPNGNVMTVCEVQGDRGAVTRATYFGARRN